MTNPRRLLLSIGATTLGFFLILSGILAAAPAAPVAAIGTAAERAVVAVPGIRLAAAIAVAQEPNLFDPATFAIALEPVAAGFTRPLYVADPGDGSGRLFVVEQDGLIRIVRGGEILPAPFLDLTGVVDRRGAERGLLGLAFHPPFAENGLFYVAYTGPVTNVVERYTVSSDDPDRADPSTAQTVLRIDDPFSNHNGGMLAFGPDGYLYTSFGDGGSSGDPNGNGQNLGTLLGKLLRIDVDPGRVTPEQPYLTPPDNPFVDRAGARPEIWAYGLRNPWRFSFDRETGDLWIADVGQGAREEVNIVPAGTTGANLGWNVTEGSTCFAAASCDTTGQILPVTEYGRDFGNSVTGGYVYRGAAFPALRGVYFYADFGSGLLWGLIRDPDGAWLSAGPIETGLNISSFGEDAAGELYLTAFDGTLYRVIASSN
ncbi:MAG: PQQ-dependent sugar dehydrogenase [Thermomicrobiales bacterium]